jgi:putative MFS transporter
LNRPLQGPLDEPAVNRGADVIPNASAELAARTDRIPTNRFHFRVAGLVGAGTFLDGFDAISLAVVLPMVVATFHISFATAGHMISMGYLGQFIGALFIGALSDRVGRKNAFLLCLVIFGALAIPCALAGSESSLMLFRFLQGLGLGAAVPIAATLVNEFLGRGNRGRFSVAYQVLFSLGLFFAPLTALMLSERMSPEDTWRTLLAVGALPIVVALVAWVALPESPRWLAERGRIAEAERIVERMEATSTAAGQTLPPV